MIALFSNVTKLVMTVSVWYEDGRLNHEHSELRLDFMHGGEILLWRKDQINALNDFQTIHFNCFPICCRISLIFYGFFS